MIKIYVALSPALIGDGVSGNYVQRVVKRLLELLARCRFESRPEFIKVLSPNPASGLGAVINNRAREQPR